MARIYKRGQTWWITYCLNKDRRRESLETKNKKQAVQMLKDIEYKISINALSPIKKISLESYRREFLEYIRPRRSESTYENYKGILNHLVRFLQECEHIRSVSDIRADMIDRFITHRLNSPSPIRLGRKISRSTVNTEIKLIKHLFSRANELNYVSENPTQAIRLLKLPQKSPRFFSEDEISTILTDCRDKWASNVYIALFLTGMRISELINLEWTDVDFDNQEIHIRVKEDWQPKGGKERSIPFSNKLFNILMNLDRKNNWVFTKADGGKINLHSIEVKFCKQLRRLNIPNASLHTWRHSQASYLTMKTGDIKAVQEILGHSSLRTTEIYSHLNKKHLHEAVRQLSDLNLGTILVTMPESEQRKKSQVVDNKVVGDTGFEPVTSTV
ncbi:tyrosine-type recombinase/integrase [Acidobacteriota bacterium]